MNRNEYLRKEANLLELSKEKIIDEVDYDFMVGYRIGYEEAYDEVMRSIEDIGILTRTHDGHMVLDYSDLAYLISRVKRTDDEISTYIRTLKADYDMYFELGANVAEDISSDIYDEFYNMEKIEMLKFLSNHINELKSYKYLGSFPILGN